MFFIFCLSTLIVSVVANNWGYITVPKNYRYQPMTDFDKARSTGRWYTHMKSPNPFGPSTVCSQADICLNPNGTITITIPGLNSITGFENVWGGTLTSKTAPKISDFICQFPHDAGRYTSVLLHTDYDNYCASLMLDNLQHDHKSRSIKAYIWISGRRPEIEEKYYKLALKVFKKNHLSTNSLSPVEQSDC